MNFLHVAILSAAGLVSTAATAAPASADGIDFGLSLGGRHAPRGFVDVHLGTPTPTRFETRVPAFRPSGYGYRGYPGYAGYTGFYSGFGGSIGGGYRSAPVATWPVYPTYPTTTDAPYLDVSQQPAVDSDCREVWIPATTTYREQVVLDPPVYANRMVPVFDIVSVPSFALRFDTRMGRMVRVQVGVRQERVQVGTRTERVLVSAGGSHIVRIPETIPGRMVRICNDRNRRFDDRTDSRDGDRDEATMTEAEYQALLQNAPAFSANR